MGKRSVGRPADPALRERILETTLLLTKGHANFRALTVDEIAKAAQTSKATIYKHWPSKSALVVESFFNSVNSELLFDPTLSPREALKKQIKRLAVLLESQQGDVLRILIAESHFDPEVRSALLQGFFLPRRASSARFIGEAIAQGALQKDLDPMLAVDVLYGSLFYVLMIGHRRMEPDWVEAFVDAVMTGLEAR